MAKAKSIPDGFHTITPHLVIKGAAKAIDFYKTAFGAEEISRHPMPDGKTLMHALLRIGDSMLMLADESPDKGSIAPQKNSASPVVLTLYVSDTDAVFQRAVKAGATATMPPADMFWGDRYSQLTDPFGHKWAIATHIKDFTPQEMEKGMREMFSQPMANKK